MNKQAAYYRHRERIELEQAERARHSSARRAHLGLAALYRREFELACAEEKTGAEAHRAAPAEERAIPLG